MIGREDLVVFVACTGRMRRFNSCNQPTKGMILVLAAMYVAFSDKDYRTYGGAWPSSARGFNWTACFHGYFPK